MKRYIFLTAIVATLATLIGCTDDLGLEFDTQSVLNYRGEPVDAYLDISVGALSVSMGTRADDEQQSYTGDEDEYDPYEDTEAERWVNDLWVFQFGENDGAVVAAPQYIKITDQEELKDVPVTLKQLDNDEQSTIYVVTNTGDDSWAISGTDTNGEPTSQFATVNDLLSAALPTREPIFVTRATTNGDLSIPMEGNSGEVTVTEDKTITVPVTRTYAKIMIAEPYLDMENWVNGEQGTTAQTIEKAEVYSVSIGNIPLYCQVGTIAPVNWDGEKAPEYPESANVQWVSRAFSDTLSTKNRSGIVQPDAGTEGNTYYPYVMYLPENLQGQAGAEGTLKLAQEEEAPSRALEINVVIACTDTEGGTTNYPYTFYPGADVYTDYNIKRNNVYRVKINISELSYERVPSANCLVALEGETIAFFPYYRVETGGGYDFEDYLYPTPGDESGKQGSKIDHVDIVWQTKDCIGDNSSGNLVYLHPNTETHTGYERIYVKANKEGNALIAAYDKENNIIWSWHIWVRTAANGDPTHPANALVYYTYDWDNTGIYSYQREEMDDGVTHRRVAGYELMACNLGALQDEPNYSVNPNFTKVTDATQSGMSDHDDNQTFVEGDGIVRTFGMLYQWGRKDPFPPMTTTKGCLAYSGTVNGTYSDYNLPDSALNSGYYVHNYDDEHTEQLYGNDNKTEVHKTSYGTETGTDGTEYLFHTHLHTGQNTTTGEEGDEGEDVISGMRYAIAHPTVFLSGASTIAVCLDGSYSNNNADYTTPLNQNSISSDGSITNYAFGGAWSNEDHDNKEWGGIEPSESTMKYFHLKYPSYSTTSSSYAGKQITDRASRTISLWDNYDNDTPEASKTIFDPCPYGWRVASGDLWLGFARNGISPYIDYDRNAVASNTTEWIGDMSNINRDPTRSCGLGMTMYLGQEWMTEPSTWFPAQGFILPDGSAYRVGGCGNYVNANTDVSDRVNVVHFHDTFNSYRQFEVQTHYTAKATGNPLRCVRDSK